MVDQIKTGRNIFEQKKIASANYEGTAGAWFLEAGSVRASGSKGGRGSIAKATRGRKRTQQGASEERRPQISPNNAQATELSPRVPLRVRDKARRIALP